MMPFSFETSARWLMGAALTASLLVIAESPASAGPNDQETKQFETLVDTGWQHYRAERFQKALEAFEKAQAIAHPESLRFRLARTLVLQTFGRCREVKRSLASSLSNDDLSTDDRRETEKRVEQLRQQCPARDRATLVYRPNRLPPGSRGRLRQMLPRRVTIELEFPDPEGDPEPTRLSSVSPISDDLMEVEVPSPSDGQEREADPSTSPDLLPVEELGSEESPSTSSDTDRDFEDIADDYTLD